MGSVKVRLSAQVQDLIGSLAPESKREMRAGLKQLAQGIGDTKTLQGELAGYNRLRISRWRVIFRYTPGASGPEISCDFAEQRDVVYQMFSALLAEEH